jgi:hypothetical protein
MTCSSLTPATRQLAQMFRKLAFVGFFLFPIFCHAQSGVTGLGRLYIEPFGKNLDVLLTAEMIQQRLPVTTTRSAQEADCVLFWMPLAETQPNPKHAAKPSPSKIKVEGNMALFDRQQKTLVWEFDVTTKPLDDLSFSDEKKLASKIVHGMNQQGAYCGGAPFSAAAQNAADRTKAFKPPFFNW